MITCHFEDGNKALLRHVTVNALIVKDNKILLGKRGTINGRPLDDAGKWALIGGFVGRDENLTQALRREIREECGCEIGNLTLLHIKDNPDRKGEDRQNIEFIFIAQGLSDVKGSDEEVARLEWYSLDKLPDEDSIAFDHAGELILYKRYLSQKFSLPFIGKAI